jgi:hypothetical protein
MVRLSSLPISETTHLDSCVFTLRLAWDQARTDSPRMPKHVTAKD